MWLDQPTGGHLSTDWECASTDVRCIPLRRFLTASPAAGQMFERFK